MFAALPSEPTQFMGWSWSQIEPYFQDLLTRQLNASQLDAWMSDWSDLSRIIEETYQRLYVAITIDTTDKQSERRYQMYLDEIYPASQAAQQKTKQKLLDSGLEPAGFEIPLLNMRTENEIYREENLPLLSKELKLSSEYDRIAGSQTVQWEGKETTISQLQPVYQEVDRDRRERAWSLASKRQLEDRQTLNQLWGEFMHLRRQLAANTSLLDYRSYRWKQMHRYDYTAQDCERFHQAIAEEVVPVASQIYEKRRQLLGVDTLRPWDLNVDPLGRAPLKPFANVVELEDRCATIFGQVDPQLGRYFEMMRSEVLLDLENRKGKAPGAYCTSFDMARKPFIFMNAVGVHDDVQTLLHEAGHAFHVFESSRLPYFHQLQVGMEFGEVASMGMELLAAPYLVSKAGGFYSPEDAARARSDTLIDIILFWPYMAVVDAFQHWVYTHPGEASDPENCDVKWAELWQRFMPGVDWSGLEDVMVTGWLRKLHIFQVPFYYIEYGMAALGANQVWVNAQKDTAGAVASYRKALSRGGSISLPQLYATAGIRFAFDASTLSSAIKVSQKTIATLEAN